MYNFCLGTNEGKNMKLKSDRKAKHMEKEKKNGGKNLLGPNNTQNQSSYLAVSKFSAHECPANGTGNYGNLSFLPLYHGT